MPVQYYFDNLDPVSFQRLVNSLLTARYGEGVRLLPLRGRDGGRDAETAIGAPTFELNVKPQDESSRTGHFPAGRYIFQVKYHRTADRHGAAVRSSVLADFNDELKSNILTQTHTQATNFFIITNVPGSKESFAKIDDARRDLLPGTNVQADVLWQEHLVSWLDQLPQVWSAFRDIFPGNVVPPLGEVAQRNTSGLPRTLRLALTTQFERDGVVRFRQINLEQRLSRLFVDLEARPLQFSTNENAQLFEAAGVWERDSISADGFYRAGDNRMSSISLLVAESLEHYRRLILEGGPGQGKSTITQAVAQLYRALLLQQSQEYQRICPELKRARFPFRIELRAFAEWLSNTDRSVELYLAEVFSKDAGGAAVTVEHIHSIVENSPALLIFDGLDEVGSDDLRGVVIEKIISCVSRFETELHSDLRCIVTSRPPAVAGCADRMQQFRRCQVLPLNPQKVDEYSRRWTEVQCSDRAERERVIESFDKRKGEQHVAALVKNPMQLSVLLHFIRLKGEAFPDRRAELYREYFKTVIDRDVEKSPALRQNRDQIEALHEVIAFEIHSRAETDLAGTQLTRTQLLEIVSGWLEQEGKKVEISQELFRLGEERLGLIVALKGEGANAQYGFEVQPVREYFAAAFINDKREGDAHELFPAMVRRTFWREVALFLAGLRRMNEKADLLSRARALDEDSLNGWRQHGRAIVLQLLVEGVLSSPGHVFRDSIAFLLDLLDPVNRTARNEPHDLVEALPKLMRLSGSDEHSKTLLTYLTSSKASDDRHSLSRLYAVASRVLPEETVWSHIAAYQGAQAHIAARVKLLWPARNGLDVMRINEIGVLPSLPGPDWATAWFSAALANPKLQFIDSTVQYHEFLVEMFAFDGNKLLAYRDIDASEISGGSPFAVWRLSENITAIVRCLASSEDVSSTPRRSIHPVHYEGLNGHIGAGLHDLVESSTSTLEQLARGQSVNRSLKPFLATLHRLLLSDGLLGWVACRCSTLLMVVVELPYLVDPGSGHLRNVSRQGESLARNKGWNVMRRSLTKFFRAGIPEDVDRAGKTFASRIVGEGYGWSIPSHFIEDGQMKSVPQMIARGAIVGGAATPEWVSRVPLARYWLREMLAYESAELESVLATFARRRITWTSPGVDLTLMEMQKVSAAVRRSSAQEVLAGALSALLGSNFINVLGVPITVAMLEADGHCRDVGFRLFPSRRRPSRAVVGKMFQLAEAVVSQAQRFSQSTANAAARFLAEGRADSLPPLSTLTSSLRLRRSE